VAGDPDVVENTPVEVRGVRFVGNARALEAVGRAVTMDRVQVSGGVSGVHATAPASLTVTRSTFRDVQFALTALFARTSVTGSSFTGNENAVSCTASLCDFTGNVFARNGIAVDSFDALATVADNDITGNDVGYQLTASNDEVLGNRFTRNVTAAQVLGSPFGAVVLRENEFVRNGVGFKARDSADTNEVTLDRNTFRRNGDGVLVEFPGVGLSRNSAIRNTRWGIYAPGAVDLGGNTARGNGNEPQCVGVVCNAS
jgi:hypothetical protein